MVEQTHNGSAEAAHVRLSPSGCQRWLWHWTLLLVLASSPAWSQSNEIEWASFAVERTAFAGDESEHYETAGQFDGIGWIYFSPAKKMIEFKGLRRIGLPYLGQEKNDKYELRFESFTLRTVIPIGDREFAFEAISNGPFARVVTGKIRYKLAQAATFPGLCGPIDEFRLDEHGQMLKGVMNTYTLPSSAAAMEMFAKYDEIFFGGNYVALDHSR